MLFFPILNVVFFKSLSRIGCQSIDAFSHYFLFCSLVMQTVFVCKPLASCSGTLLTQANEDCNCYSYDARKLDEAKCVHKDHVSAV